MLYWNLMAATNYHIELLRFAQRTGGLHGLPLDKLKEYEATVYHQFQMLRNVLYLMNRLHDGMVPQDMRTLYETTIQDAVRVNHELRDQLQQIRSEYETTKRELQDRLEQSNLRLDNTSTELRDQFQHIHEIHETTIRQLRDQLQQSQQLHEAEKSAMSEKHEKEMTALKNEGFVISYHHSHEALSAEYEARLAKVGTDHAASLIKIEQQITQIRRQNRLEVQSLKDKALAEKQSLIESHQREIAALKEKMQADLDASRREAQQRLDDTKRTHKKEKMALNTTISKLTEEVDRLRKENASMQELHQAECKELQFTLRAQHEKEIRQLHIDYNAICLEKTELVEHYKAFMSSVMSDSSPKTPICGQEEEADDDRAAFTELQAQVPEVCPEEAYPEMQIVRDLHDLSVQEKINKPADIEEEESLTGLKEPNKESVPPCCKLKQAKSNKADKNSKKAKKPSKAALEAAELKARLDAIERAQDAEALEKAKQLKPLLVDREMKRMQAAQLAGMLISSPHSQKKTAFMGAIDEMCQEASTLACTKRMERFLSDD